MREVWPRKTDTVTVEALQTGVHAHQGKKHQGEDQGQNLTEPPHPQSQKKPAVRRVEEEPAWGKRLPGGRGWADTEGEMSASLVAMFNF